MQNNEIEKALNTTPLGEQIGYLTEAVNEGYVNPLEASIALKQIEAIIAAAKIKIKEATLEEASKYTTQPFINNLGKVEMRASASRWKFDHIEEWNSKKAELKEIEDMAKMAHKAVGFIYDDEGVQVVPAVKNGGKDSIFITLKK